MTQDLYNFLVDDQRKSSRKQKGALTKPAKRSGSWTVAPGSDVVTSADYFATEERRNANYYGDPQFGAYSKSTMWWINGCDTTIDIMKNPTVGMTIGAALELIDGVEYGMNEMSRVCGKLTKVDAVGHYKDLIKELLVSGNGRTCGKVYPSKPEDTLKSWRMVRNILVDVVGVPWPGKIRHDDVVKESCNA